MSGRRFQIKLSVVMLLITVWCCNFATWHYQQRQIQEDKHNLETLEKFGVSANFNSDGVTQVHFKPGPNDLRLTDEHVHLLARFPNVWALDLRCTNITDEGVDSLFEMRKLHWVYLSKTSVSEAKVAELKRRIPNIIVVLW